MLRNDPAKTWIKPDKTFNSTHPNSQNFLIKGDNLEALKLLKNAYEKKIKMIYIDPPYNTGNNDFVYKDDRKYTPKELSSLCGMSEEECKKMLEYYSKGKNSHSAWLTFMYPRLSLARNLLKEDGVIFISIDDNEQAQLKLLCDEIFGEENFVANFVWEKTQHFGRQKLNSYSNSEFVLCYAKQLQDANGLKCLLVEKILQDFDDAPLYNKSNPEKILTLPKEHIIFKIPDGIYHSSTDEEKYKLLESVEIVDGKSLSDIKILFRSRWTNQTLQEEVEKVAKILIKSDKFSPRILYSEDKSGKVAPRQIIFTNKNNPLCTKYNEIKIGTNSDGSSELQSLFETEVFSYPKPTSLILYLIAISQMQPNDIILDFFAGSGTTAQAVMELNAEDGGNRQFILVQLPELIDKNNKNSKTAYDFVKNTLGKDEPKISDITQERIIRASKQIQEKYPEYQGDLGFQVFELEEIPSELTEIRQSNFEKINHLFANEDIDKMLDIEAILQSFCLYDSIPLGAELEKVDLGGYIAYKFQERIYLLHQGFQTKHLQEFLRKMDDEESFCVGEIVLLAYCFESARRREIAEAISYYNKKSRELKIVVRG